MARPTTRRSATARDQDSPQVASPLASCITRLSPGEWLGLALVVAAGALLRAGWLERLAVEHFDEGVYASNLWFADSPGGEFPGRHLYAPPLFPWLVEWSIVILGDGPAGCFAVPIALGTATIAVVWGLARRWFASGPATIAALALAASGSHCTFSRACLTDVPLGLPWVLALGFFAEAVTRGSRRWAIAAGACIGIAWSLKYNGWLPLAIGVAGTAAWGLAARPGRQTVRRSVEVCGVAALTALAVFAPVWRGLQPHGGYAAVAANHAGYFHGFSGWWPALRRQADALSRLEFAQGRVTACLVALALSAGAALLAARFTWNARPTTPDDPSIPLRNRATLASAIAAWLVATATAATVWKLAGAGWLLLGAGLAGAALVAADSARGAPTVARHPMAGWTLAAWVGSLLVLTPLYHPYPRILVPWVVASCIGLGGLAACLRDAARRLSDSISLPLAPRRRALGVSLVVATGSLFVALPNPTATGMGGSWWESPPHERRDGLARIAAEVGRSAALAAGDADGPAVIYVFAEPALVFHLRAAGAAAGPVANLAFDAPRIDGRPLATFLVVGPHARRSAGFEEAWETAGGRFENVAEWDDEPSLLVLLDERAPRELVNAARTTQPITLYRVR